MNSKLMSVAPIVLVFAMTWPTALAGPSSRTGMRVTKQPFGKLPDGRSVDQYTLSNGKEANGRGLEVKVMTYGATIIGVVVPDRQGRRQNVTLYLDRLRDYAKGHPLFGALVGRYANRIAGARFTIDGVEYGLTANAGKNHIHGGRQGFQKIVWDAKPLRQDDRVGVRLTHTSPDGHEGYPGTLTVKVSYAVTRNNELVMQYWATSDKPTHLNLTNHAYWNLAGAGSGNVLQHVVTIHAHKYVAADRFRFPTGEILGVKGTPLDFTTPHTIGARIDQLDGKNYDHCYVLDKEPGQRLSLAAHVVDPRSGRAMDVFTTQPGMQFYTAKGLSNRYRTKDAVYGPYHGFCLETQHFPDSPNHAQFPSTLLRPGQTFHQTTIYRFSVEAATKEHAVQGSFGTP